MKPYFSQRDITLYHGDAVEVMALLPAESIERCVTDPPYDLTAGNNGGGFMGQKWDGTGVAFQPETWQAVLRILKPGAHLLSFGGTRTSHRLVCAIEDAGFEIRDSVVWLYASGFPKSLDIGKALDRAAGMEREVIGQTAHKSGIANATKGHHTVGGTIAEHIDITAPATEAAKQWDGFGTGLAPSHEPICVAQKPLDGTFAENAIKHGVAGLNIDGARIGTTVETWPSSRSYGTKAKKFNSYDEQDAETQQTGPVPQGRWPKNTVFVHSPDCRLVGTKRVKGSNASFQKTTTGSIKPNSIYGKTKRVEEGEIGYADADGLETVESWICSESCPVAELERQSGGNPSPMPSHHVECRPVTATSTIPRPNVDLIDSDIDQETSDRVYDTLIAEGKLTKTQEEWECAEGCPVAELDRQSGVSTSDNRTRPSLAKREYTEAWRFDNHQRVGFTDTGGASRFFFTAKAAKNQRAFYCRDCKDAYPATRRDAHQHGRDDNDNSHIVGHPTVKPLAIMEYLLKLSSTPSGGTVIDPFAGSGTTGLAAYNLGVPCILIEQDEQYCEIIARRFEAEMELQPLFV